MQTETYKCTDLVTKKQVAVLVQVPNHIYGATRQMNDHRLKAVGKLMLITLYFLLRVGEYTHHSKGIQRTQQFCLCNMKSFINEWQIMPDQLVQHFWQINLVCLTMDNQKNGNWGQNLSHHALMGDNWCCPIKAVVARAIDMVCNGATPETLICAFKDAPSLLPWQQVQSQDIVNVVKDALPAIGLENSCFEQSDVGSHSLQARVQWQCIWTATQHLRFKGQDVGQVQHFLNISTVSCLPWWENQHNWCQMWCHPSTWHDKLPFSLLLFFGLIVVFSSQKISSSPSSTPK